MSESDPYATSYAENKDTPAKVAAARRVRRSGTFNGKSSDFEGNPKAPKAQSPFKLKRATEGITVK